MAINPLPFLQAMPDPGQAFMDSFQKARAARVAEDQKTQQQILQEQRKQRYAALTQQLMKDPSAPNQAVFAIEFPEESKAINEVFSKLTDEQKKNRFNQSSTALQMLEAGDVEGAKRYGQQILTAAENSPGQQEYAKALKYNLELLDKNPAAAKLGIAKSTYYLDPEGYKALYDKEKDPFIPVAGIGVFSRKELEAAIAAEEKGVKGVTVKPIQEGATATNPKTGQKLQFKNGQWVPVGGGSGNATGGF